MEDECGYQYLISINTWLKRCDDECFFLTKIRVHSKEHEQHPRLRPFFLFSSSENEKKILSLEIE